ncbi:hypothetical protein [Arthrobacter sp. B2a2-09]|uniref:hypothetical protein n=1 Tax=Arthrobacter sp. B2a2-09 TaxID=2952822 RepID=UPI0022CDA066|nr:hypothetical protein [Arthrobacter sp. B2a2-09]
MTAAAAILTIVGMAAAVVRPGCSRTPATTAVVIGAIMLAVLLLPDFSNVAAAAVTLALLPAVAGALLWQRVKTRRQLTGLHKTAAGLAVVDTGFMALALFLMPVHGAGQPQASAVPMAGMSGHMSHMAGGGLMSVLVLLGWMVCAAVVAVPAIRLRTRGIFPHAVCSGCMILAMGVMAM